MSLEGLQARLAQLDTLGALRTAIVHDVTEVTVASPAYHDRTPVEEKSRLDEHGGKQPAPGMATEDDVRALLDNLAAGKTCTFSHPQKDDRDEHGRVIPGSGVSSIAVKGLPATRYADYCIASMPGSDKEKYSDVVYSCAAHGLGLAVVFEVDWGEDWFLVWKRNVEHMVEAGKALIVLTQAGGSGQLGFAQTMEVMYLREKGYPFTVVDIAHFVRAMRPLSKVACMICDGVLQISALEALLAAPPVPGAPALVGARSVDGSSAIHDAAFKGAPSDVLEILSQGAGQSYLNSRMFRGQGSDMMTPLMKAARQGWPDTVHALLRLRADAALQDEHGRTALDLALMEQTAGCRDVVTVLEGPGSRPACCRCAARFCAGRGT